MRIIIPDIDWYTRRSQEMGVTPRCPFSSVEACPRYYQSLSLLKDAGSTAIEPKEDQRLLKYWKKSDLWPKTEEQATSIAGEPENPSLFWNFCPEVAFDRFGYFASSLNAYADEIDHDLAHKKLGEEHAVSTDWRWVWASINPLHYTECPLYSILEHRSKRDEVLPEKPPELFQKIAWFLRHWRRHWLIILIAVAITILSALWNLFK